MRIGMTTALLAVALGYGGTARADDDGARITKLERDVLELRGAVVRGFEAHRALAHTLQAWRDALAARHGVKYEFPNLNIASRAVPRSLFGQNDQSDTKRGALVRELAQLRTELRALRENDAQMRRAFGQWQASIHRWRGGAAFLILDGSAPAEMNMTEGDGSYDWIASQATQMRGALEGLRGSVVRLAQQMQTWKRAIEDWQGAQFLPSNFDVDANWPRGFLSPNRGASNSAQ